VVHDAPVPVLVVRADAVPEDADKIFAKPVVVAGPEFHGEARRYAGQLAARFDTTVGEKPVASLSDLSCDPGATLMVVAVGPHHGSAWFGDVADRLVRSCQLPMLFVPGRG